MGASQIGVYNKALRWLEERKIANLTEGREPVRYLNDEWEDGVNFCLSQGFWNHSIRQQQIPADTSRAPAFGYQFCFAKPTDWVRTFLIADNSDFNPPLRLYLDQNAVWFSNISPLYVMFVSNDPNFGWNLSLWTPGFTEYVAAYLASLIVPRLKQNEQKIETIMKLVKAKRLEALAVDAMDLPPKETPVGTWVQSRAPRGSIYPWGNPSGTLDD